MVQTPGFSCWTDMVVTPQKPSGISPSHLDKNPKPLLLSPKSYVSGPWPTHLLLPSLHSSFPTTGNCHHLSSFRGLPCIKFHRRADRLRPKIRKAWVWDWICSLVISVEVIYFTKKKGSKISNLNFHLKKLEKEKQTKAKASIEGCNKG